VQAYCKCGGVVKEAAAAASPACHELLSLSVREYLMSAAGFTQQHTSQPSPISVANIHCRL
jgi:hypothetical protein